MQPAKKQLIQQAFAGWTPGSPLSRQQTELLYKNEAVHIYAALSRDTVTFPPADSAAINERIVQGLRAGKTLYSMADLVTTKREEYLIGKLQGFYKEHPGATAAVIFGSGHDILRYCNAADFPPKASWYNCSGGDMAAVERERATMRNASQRG